MPERRRSREIERLVDELIEAVESAISARARVLTEEYMRAGMEDAPRAVRGNASTTEASSEDAPLPPPRVRRVRPRPAVATKPKALPVVDPDEERRKAERADERRAAELEQERRAAERAEERRAAELEEERRTAELARLRAILRPTVPEPPATPVIAASSPPTPEDDGSLQALENQIREQIPSLPNLSVARYTAQIAAWVGRVRLIQSGPDGERTRIASRIMFDKLRNLAWSMEAGTIEGLNLSWSTRNWERYIKDNELIAATPDPPSRPEPDPEADVWSTPGEADAQV